MVYVDTSVIELGTTLPSNSRLWSLQVFTERHTKLYGAGNIMPEEWPERNVHSDDQAAQREGLSGAVAAAPQIISQIQRMMLQAFGAGWIRGGQISVKMIRPVVVDDFTTSHGRVVSVDLLDDNTRRVKCQVWVDRQDGTKVMVGEASAVVRLCPFCH